MEEARQKISQDLAKTLEMLEEWKKLQKKKIIQSFENIFFHFPKNIGRMEEAKGRFISEKDWYYLQGQTDMPFHYLKLLV